MTDARLDRLNDVEFFEATRTPEQKYIEDIEARITSLEAVVKRLQGKRHWHYVYRQGQMSNIDKPYEGYEH